ncbi:MAG: OmpH family outer membrane protein [Candidatus Omnitrophica bacterium]|nr:OmpH family outer membrane protein [Candidatus Omnitrophota bacterium]
MSPGHQVTRSSASIAVLLTLLLSGGMIARAAGEEKIGYVDLGRVFDEYNRTKHSEATLEQRGKQKEAELEGRLTELKKLRESLELMNDEAREVKAREVEEKAESLQQFRNSAARDLRRERDKVAKAILQDIQTGIQEYGKANGFSMIFDARSLLYAEEAHDVTDEILKLLNGRAKPTAR